MYSLTTLEGTLLALGILATTTVLVLGVLFLFPRAAQAVTAIVYRPMMHRRARAELARDAWTRRFVDVTSCSVLGARGVVFCRKACRSAPGAQSMRSAGVGVSQRGRAAPPDPGGTTL